MKYLRSSFKWDQSHLSSSICWEDIGKSRLLAQKKMEKIAIIFKVVFFSMDQKIETVSNFFQMIFMNYWKISFKWDQTHLSSLIRWGDIGKSRLLAYIEMGKVATIIFSALNMVAHHIQGRKKSIFLKKRLTKDFLRISLWLCFQYPHTTPKWRETWSDPKNDLAVSRMHSAPLFVFEDIQIFWFFFMNLYSCQEQIR